MKITCVSVWILTCFNQTEFMKRDEVKGKATKRNKTD